MNRAALFILGSVMLLLNCSTAHGQGCGTILQPHFSVYNSVSRDGNNIYTSSSIQGYATIGFSAGCNMSSATHHVGAENKLNNVDHWTYSANGCPNCYFSATNNEQIVGVPGVEYPFVWEGAAICSIDGQFFGNGGSSNILGCIVPSSETTTWVKVDPGIPTATDFNQTISDTHGDNWNSQLVKESDAASAQDTCHFAGSKYPPVTGVAGSEWTVAGGDVVGAYNHWGYDTVGWYPEPVNYYRTQAPLHGIGIPCGYIVYQLMQVACPSGQWVPYTPSYGNKLTGQIEQTTVVNCRNDMNNSDCQTINY